MRLWIPKPPPQFNHQTTNHHPNSSPLMQLQDYHCPMTLKQTSKSQPRYQNHATIQSQHHKISTTLPHTSSLLLQMQQYHYPTALRTATQSPPIYQYHFHQSTSSLPFVAKLPESYYGLYQANMSIYTMYTWQTM